MTPSSGAEIVATVRDVLGADMQEELRRMMMVSGGPRLARASQSRASGRPARRQWS